MLLLSNGAAVKNCASEVAVGGEDEDRAVPADRAGQDQTEVDGDHVIVPLPVAVHVDEDVELVRSSVRPTTIVLIANARIIAAPTIAQAPAPDPGPNQVREASPSPADQCSGVSTYPA